MTGGEDLTLGEFQMVGEWVRERVSKEAMVIMGAVIDEHMREAVKITLMLTGLRQDEPKKQGTTETLVHGSDIPAYLRRRT